MNQGFSNYLEQQMRTLLIGFMVNLSNQDIYKRREEGIYLSIRERERERGDGTVLERSE